MGISFGNVPDRIKLILGVEFFTLWKIYDGNVIRSALVCTEVRSPSFRCRFLPGAL